MHPFFCVLLFMFWLFYLTVHSEGTLHSSECFCSCQELNGKIVEWLNSFGRKELTVWLKKKKLIMQTVALKRWLNVLDNMAWTDGAGS